MGNWLENEEKNMTVGSILDEKGRHVITLGLDTSITDALKLLEEKSIGVVLITAADGSLAGILSERDIVRSLARSGVGVLKESAAGHMTNDVVTCSENDAVIGVMEVMSKGRFRHLPVTNDGKLIGLISIGDVVKRRLQVVEKEAEDIRSYLSAI